MACAGFQKEVIFFCIFVENVESCTFPKFSTALLSVSESMLGASCPSARIIAAVSCQV